MNTSSKHSRRGWKVAFTLGFALLLGFGSAGMAQATTSSDPSAGNVDTSKTGSLIIHKGQSNGSTSDTNKGTASGTAPSGFTGLAGVKFTAYKITDIDLGTSAGWTAVNNLGDISAACTAGSGGVPALSGHTLGTGTETTATDSNGLTTLSALSVAAYLVCETTSPAAVVDKAQPFVVTVPFPDNDASKGWLYNVNVWPKNSLATISKSVTQQTDLGLGSVAKFPVSTTLAKIASNANYKYFIIEDPLDSRLTSGGVDSVTLDGAAVAASNYTVTVTGNTVDVSFTQSGLTLLKNNPGKVVVVTFKGTVSSLGDGIIKNTATLYADTQVSTVPPTTPPVTPPDTPGVPSNEVKQNWGDLVISKVADDANNSALQGAKFKVYAAADPYAATCAAAKTGNALTVSGNTEFTTGTDGLAKIAGLFISDSVNAPINATTRCYVVEETAAPAGYVLPLNAPVAVKVTIGQTNGFDVQIVNSKTSVPELPLTGANGQLVMMLVGGALILIAAGSIVIVRARRRSRQS